MTSAQVVGQHREAFLPAPTAAAHRANDLEVVASRRSISVEETAHLADGEHTYLTVKFPILDARGEVAAIGGISNDITERKRAEAERASLIRQLHQAQKMEAIGQLAGGIAHDFNNILAVILGTADQVALTLPGPDALRTHMERIARVARRARDLTRRLLTFARQEKLEVRTLGADALIQELVDLLKRSLSKQVVIRTDCGPDSPTLAVDVNQMLQALLNVCINAADAMPGGGTLTLGCDEQRLQDVAGELVPAAGPGRYARITITDTGTGMPEPVKSQLFDPFFTTKAPGKGTGLGLPISLAIVQGHGGAIRVESAPGQGTRVEIYLPVAGTALEDQPECSPAPLPGVGPARILVVDDDRDVLDTTTEILRLAGFTVIPASEPEAALECFRREGPSIDLVILDMMLPRMSGDEVFRVLRSMDPGVKVLVCSGFSAEGQASRILAEGACAFLQKPFDHEELLAAVTGLIR